MGKGGFSWKRLTGITKAKQKVSRKTGIPLTKSGRQRKIGKIVTGGKGCLVTILLPILFILMLIFVNVSTHSQDSDSKQLKPGSAELSLSDASEEEINGLSENKRKEIFKQVYQAYTQAEDEGDRMYPIDDPELSLEQMKQRIDASRAYSDKIKNKENKKITAKYKITTEQITEILNEGLIKHWSRK